MAANITKSIYILGRRIGDVKNFAPAQKLWMSFGVLTALFALVCVFILLRMQSLEKLLHEHSQVNQPRSVAATELENHTLGYALAVRTHLQQGGQNYQPKAEEASEMVDWFQARYIALAKTDLQREFNDRFSTLWQDMKTQGQLLLDDKKQPATALTLHKFQAASMAMIQFLNSEMQPDATNALNSQKDAIIQQLRTSQGLLLVLLTVGVCLVGVLSLVTGGAIARENETMQESRDQLQKVFDKTAMPTMLHNGMDVLLINDAWTNLTGFQRQDIPTIAAWKRLAQVENIAFNPDHLESMAGTSTRVDHGESKVATAAGQWRNCRFLTTPLGRDADGQCLFVSNAIDETESIPEASPMKAAEKPAQTTDLLKAQIMVDYRQQLDDAKAKLSALEATDTLTHLHNRRALQEKLADEVKRTARYGLPLSLLLVDVDQFQQFSDSFGNTAGDEVLRDVGRLLEESMRATDFTARYGGEEFAILLPGTGREGAAFSAEKVRKAVAEEHWPDRNITVSVGVATLTGGYGDGSELMEQADTALYYGKKKGCNSIHVARENFGTPMAMW